jgi:hypothetical protein
MKAVLGTLSAMVLAMAVGCDEKKPGAPAAPANNGVEVNAPGVNVRTGDKAAGGGVEVNTPATNVDVNKTPETK